MKFLIGYFPVSTTLSKFKWNSFLKYLVSRAILTHVFLNCQFSCFPGYNSVDTSVENEKDVATR